MNNPLVNALSPKVRMVLYVVAFLASLGLGAWLASDGDWTKAVGLFIGALLSATAASNASPTPVKATRNQRGDVDLVLLFSVLTFVGVVLLLFRVRFGG